MKWKRIIGWSLGGLLILLLIVAAAGYLYLQTSSFQQLAIREISKRVEASTGARTHVGGIGLQLSKLEVELYDITLRGTEASYQPPLVHADKLIVQAKIISLTHFNVGLKEILLEHPVVHLTVSQSGASNVPAPPPTQSNGHTNVFELAVQHAQLTNGEINYNDKKIPLEGGVYALNAQIDFTEAKHYRGEISYRDGLLHYAQYQSLSHALSIQFDAAPDRLILESAILRVNGSEANVHGQLVNYSNPAADVDYTIRVHTQDFAAMSPTLRPAGDLTFEGHVRYQNEPDLSPLRSVIVEGKVASDVLVASTQGRRIEVKVLRGGYSLKNADLVIRDATAETMGGRAAVIANLKDLDRTPESSIKASLTDISLRQVQHELGAQEIPQATVSGTLQGNVAASWLGSVSNLKALADVYVRADAGSRSNPSASVVPVIASLHSTYDGLHQTIEMHNTTLTLPSAKVTVQGTVSNHSSLQIQAAVSDLHQFVALATSFEGSKSRPPEVSGAATVNAFVHGSIKRPTFTAQLAAEDLAIDGSGWKKLSASLTASPSEVRIENASIMNAKQGSATLNASVGLRNWSYEPSNPISARLNAKQLRLAELEALADQQLPVSGDLTATLDVRGSQVQPDGSGTLEIVNAKAYGEVIDKFNTNFHTENGTIHSTLRMELAAGTLNASLSVNPKTKAYAGRIDVPKIELQKLQTVLQKNIPISGTVAFTAAGQGYFDDPQLTVAMDTQHLQVRENSISELKAQVRLAEHRADLELDSQIAQATVHARGNVMLTGDYPADVVIDTGTIPLAPVLATYSASVPEGFQGETELHAALKGPLKDKSRLEAHVSIPVLKVAYQSLTVGIPHPIQADYSNSIVTLQPAELTGTGTSLKAEGRIPIGTQGAPTLTAQGSIDLRIVQLFVPDIQSSGVLGLDVHSAGKAISGQLKLQNVAMTTADAPVGVEKLNGTIDIANDHLQIGQMNATVGGGPVSLGGSIAYRPSIQYNLAIQGKQIRLLYPTGLRSLLDANLTLGGTPEGSTLAGRVLIDSLSFTPDFDLSKFSDQFSTGGTVSQPGFADTVKLSVLVQSQQSLNAVSSQVSIAGQVALQVRGTAGDPVITGRTTLTSGELFYRNVRYQLQRGVITFDNPNETHPVLNVSVATTVEQYNLTLTLRGPLDKLTTSYVSDPPLATADIINLIARGQTTEESAASSQSTDSMIASQVAGQVAGSLQKLAGISSLEIDPSLGGNQNPSARIAVQQRVTKNLLFSFSTDVSQPGSEIVQGEYQINKRWSVSVQRDQLGGVSVDGKYHKRF